MVLAPLVIDSIYSYASMRDGEKLLIVALTVWRIVHGQIWISVSRYLTAKGAKRIVNKSIEFDQVDRERTWDDQVIFNSLVIYLLKLYVLGTNTLPFWRLDGMALVVLLHVGPVEFIYYWFHRALHHHFLYSRYHSHHHSSIVTEPITAVVHPFAEHISYTIIVAGIPIVTTFLCGTVSHVSIFLYISYIDFMNSMGHCNIELIPRSFFSLFPPLKYLLYTPSFHSLHHTQFRTNYALTMPIYDYMYGTNDKSSDSLYETSLEQEEEKPDAIHLTHLTSLDSIYHFRLGFSSLSSHPLSSRCYLVLMRPFTIIISFILTSFSSRAFVFERNRFRDLTIHSHLLPKFSSHIWLVGDGLSKEDQKKARKGTLFIPFSQFPPSKLLKDCFYHTTPAMIIPDSAQNIDSCENWLGRRVMSAWRVGGIVHALEGWEEHECGLEVPMANPPRVWEAALRNGFKPLVLPSLETK
ncbi:hypothetical protein DY000_02002026 [Brassica cretica]|uniref:Fatty acid hydroxylase domain-containing protein n=1 Tax=Brassica cretica TaxID=69181 RepID=A0ABQ7C7W3_BRACR|nr:hypothetical protein DY000_02002026 [Brassica cretica]